MNTPMRLLKEVSSIDSNVNCSVEEHADEEYKYGPGIVNRLKAKFINLMFPQETQWTHENFKRLSNSDSVHKSQIIAGQTRDCVQKKNDKGLITVTSRSSHSRGSSDRVVSIKPNCMRYCRKHKISDEKSSAFLPHMKLLFETKSVPSLRRIDITSAASCEYYFSCMAADDGRTAATMFGNVTKPVLPPKPDFLFRSSKCFEKNCEFSKSISNSPKSETDKKCAGTENNSAHPLVQDSNGIEFNACQTLMTNGRKNCQCSERLSSNSNVQANFISCSEPSSPKLNFKNYNVFQHHLFTSSTHHHKEKTENDFSRSVQSNELNRDSIYVHMNKHNFANSESKNLRELNNKSNNDTFSDSKSLNSHNCEKVPRDDPKKDASAFKKNSPLNNSQNSSFKKETNYSSFTINTFNKCTTHLNIPTRGCLSPINSDLNMFVSKTDGENNTNKLALNCENVLIESDNRSFKKEKCDIGAILTQKYSSGEEQKTNTVNSENQQKNFRETNIKQESTAFSLQNGVIRHSDNSNEKKSDVIPTALQINSANTHLSAAKPRKSKLRTFDDIQTSMIFDFARDKSKDIPDYIENDGLDFTRRRKSNLILDGRMLVQESLSKEPALCEDKSNYNIQVLGGYIVINGKSSLITGSRIKKSLKISFNDSATVIHEYPSEESVSESTSDKVYMLLNDIGS